MKSNKDLSELSTEELGKLFPIEIIPYQDSWKRNFKNENSNLMGKLGVEIALKIEHFGSTAIEGISAKPIIDILVEIPELTDVLKKKIIDIMSNIGYHFIWRTDNEIPYMNFVKGYTLNGFKGNVYHIHMADKKHNLWDRIYFRDYLKNHIEIAKEYENLKIKFAEKYKYNREDYTNSKSEFVERITKKAKLEIKK